MSDKTPNYLNLFNGSSPYSKDSISVQQSRLKKLKIVDEAGIFTEWFFDEYTKRYVSIPVGFSDALRLEETNREVFGRESFQSLLGFLMRCDFKIPIV